MNATSSSAPATPCSVLKISETILKTGQFDLMKAWYRAVLDVDVFFEHQPAAGAKPGDFGGQTRASDLHMCFFRLSVDFPYTQMIGVFEEPGTEAEVNKRSPGLHHMQLMLPDFDTWIAKYEALARLGKKPHRCANHGIMTSFYYRDPDGNNVELTVQNFASLEAMKQFMQSAYFAGNPSGIEIADADAFVARYRSGVPAEEMTRLA